MRRFFIGLLIGVIAGFAVAWWRLDRARRMGPAEVELEPVRIALPDLPLGDGDEEDIDELVIIGRWP
ncbi:MAG: hypothetical protein ACE5LU_00995 [Anaerolineae bacterium]